MQTPRSSTKRRIFEELNQSMNENIPPNVRLIHEKVSQQTINLGEKFRNLEDPLGFIHNDHLQNLVKNTKQTARKLKQGMQETCELSKNMYKNMISTDEGKHSIFENFQQKVYHLCKQQVNEKEIIKTQTKLKNRKVINDPMLILVKHLKAREINEKIKNSRGPQLYRHQREQILPTQIQPEQKQLTFDHIKLIGTPQFYKTCKNVEFYDILKKMEQQPKYVPSQVFDIHKNYFIDKKMINIDFKMIETSCEWDELSKEIFYDFDKNLKYWKHATKENPSEQKQQQWKDQLKEENILPNFLKFNKKQIDINNILDFASGKVNSSQLKGYFSFKKQHKIKELESKQDENLQEKYETLKKQYDHAHQLRLKVKAQGIPLKYTETECQTIKLMQEKDFDDYFNEDLNSLFVNLDKLNKVRQRALTDRTKRDKIVITKNACLQIKQNLFKLLTMVLKGEKFYPRSINIKNYSPYFTYNDLFDVENRQQVENKILELIYDKIDEFQYEQVDNIKKTDLIRIYVEERQNNTKILEMIQTVINSANPTK